MAGFCRDGHICAARSNEIPVVEVMLFKMLLKFKENLVILDIGELEIQPKFSKCHQ